MCVACMYDEVCGCECSMFDVVCDGRALCVRVCACECVYVHVCACRLAWCVFGMCMCMHGGDDTTSVMLLLVVRVLCVGACCACV